MTRRLIPSRRKYAWHRGHPVATKLFQMPHEVMTKTHWRLYREFLDQRREWYEQWREVDRGSPVAAENIELLVQFWQRWLNDVQKAEDDENHS